MEYFFIILFSLFFVWLSWRRPDYALFVIVACLPSYIIRFQIGFVPMTLLEAMVLILFVVSLFNRKIAWQKIYQSGFFWPAIAVLAAATIAVFVSPNRIGALGLWKAYFIEPALLAALVVSQAHSRRAFEGLIWALGASAAALSLFSLWQKMTALGVPQPYLDQFGGVDRVVGIFGYPNALGLFLGPIVVLFLGFLAIKKSAVFERAPIWLLQLLKSVIAALSFITIILAQSEGAILAVVAVSFFLALTVKKLRAPALIIAAISAIIILSFEPLRGFVLEKLLLQDYSGGIRRMMWQETWMMLKDHWFFGVGLDGYRTVIAPYHAKTFEIFLYPHTTLFNFWSELGLLGVAAFIWLGVKFFWTNIKVISNKIQKYLPAKIWAVTFIAIVVEILIHGLVDAPYFKNDLSILVWIFVGLAVINSKLAKE